MRSAFGILVLVVVAALWLRMPGGEPRAVAPARVDLPACASPEPPVMASESPPALPAPGAAPAEVTAGARVRVVFDPGHGGKDQGGQGRRTTDRDVAMAVAQELNTLLAGDPRIEPVFTREGNYFVPLDQRVEIARRAGAAAFVSLHANVWNSASRVNGLEVEYPSERLARAELGRIFNEKGLGAFGAAVPWTPEALASAGLAIWTQRVTRERSQELARALHDHVIRWTGQHGRGIRPAGYRVLRPYALPTCLIELGFLTDPAEEDLMISPEWRQRTARGIREGLIAWLDAQPAAEARPEPRLAADALRTLVETVTTPRAVLAGAAPRAVLAGVAPGSLTGRAHAGAPAHRAGAISSSYAARVTATRHAGWSSPRSGQSVRMTRR